MFGVIIGDEKANIPCSIEYSPYFNTSAPYHEVPVSCGGTQDTLRLAPSETTIEIRAFMDWTFTEVYFQKGRVAMTVVNNLSDDTDISLTATADVTAQSVTTYPIKGIWTTPEAVRSAP